MDGYMDKCASLILLLVPDILRYVGGTYPRSVGYCVSVPLEESPVLLEERWNIVGVISQVTVTAIIYCVTGRRKSTVCVDPLVAVIIAIVNS